MTKTREAVTAGLLRFPGVELRPSRFGGKDAFFIGRREFAHFESEGVLDIRLTRSGIRSLKAELGADPRLRLRGSSDWCEFSIEGDDGVSRALELLELARAANDPT